MSGKRVWLIVFLILLLAVSLFFLWGTLFPRYAPWALFPKLPNISLSQTPSASWSVLEAIDHLENFETAQYRMTYVFPFDFVTSPAVNWLFLKSQYDLSPDQFLTRIPPWGDASSSLPPVWQDAALYALCRQVGIDPGKPDYRFVVITAQVRAGLDLAQWHEQIARCGHHIQETPEGDRILLLPPPPVALASFSISDTDNTAQGFPDVSLSPEEWGTLIRHLEPLIQQQALEEGLMEHARAETEQLIRDIFQASGYRDVRFATPGSPEWPANTSATSSP